MAACAAVWTNKVKAEEPASAAASPSTTESTAMESTPITLSQPKEIRKIFEIESTALGYSEFELKDLLKKYNGYVESIVKIVKDEKIDINNEGVFFPRLASIFYSDLGASFGKDRMVMTSLLNNKFNCYSFSVLFAEVCAKLGKKVDVITAPYHVFLSGKDFCFEAIESTETCIFPKNKLDERYPFHWAGGLNFLVAEAYAMAGSIYADEKREYDEAIEYFKKAIELDSQGVSAYNNLGNAYYNKKEYDRAIDYFKKAIELDPKNKYAYTLLGYVYSDKDQYDKAIECYKKLIEICPKSAWIYSDLGHAYSKLGNKVKAKEYFETSKRLSRRAKIFHKGKAHLDKAVKYFNKLIEMDPKNADAYNTLGNVYVCKQDYGEAIKCYKKSIELDPKCVRAYYNMGNAYIGLGNGTKAKECFEIADRLSSKAETRTTK
jgi:tetratricopeptide (TPR) repeat protein